MVRLLGAEEAVLAAWATKDQEEEVMQGVRVPLGRDFPGRVAAEHRQSSSKKWIMPPCWARCFERRGCACDSARRY